MSKKLVLFGDSHFGKCGREKIISLEKKLGEEFDVYNCAAGGWNSEDILKKSEYIASLKPDVIAISDGTNDIDPPKDIELDKFKANIEEIIDIFSGSLIILLPAVPLNESMLSAQDKHLNNETLRPYAQAIEDIAARRDVGYIDSWNIFMGLQSRGENYHEDDGVHLIIDGYNVLFDALAKVVKP